MTTDPQNPNCRTSSKAQSPLPFDERDLLAVRLLPSEFARAIGVSKQTVSRWIHDDKVTLGADGRMNPSAAMRQLLRTGNPGRIRARLVRQAFADMADLRAQAARADQLSQRVATLVDQIDAERFEADQDYETIDRWLTEFSRRIATTPRELRAGPDAEWHKYVSETMTRVMAAEDISSVAALHLEGGGAIGNSFTNQPGETP